MFEARPFLAAAAAVFAASAVSSAAPARVRTGAAGGIAWRVPAHWTDGVGSAMRVATYDVPAAKGSEPAECAVFFFGSGQGGSVDANLQRWGRQFQGAPAPTRTTVVVGGLQVTRAQVTGTYLAPGGPMMQSTGKRPGYRLLGAIAEGPQGNVFFKLTGPVATVVAAKPAFDALLASLHRQ
jgi:hypothetical protein